MRVYGREDRAASGLDNNGVVVKTRQAFMTQEALERHAVMVRAKARPWRHK